MYKKVLSLIGLIEQHVSHSFNNTFAQKCLLPNLSFVLQLEYALLYRLHRTLVIIQYTKCKIIFFV